MRVKLFVLLNSNSFFADVVSDCVSLFIRVINLSRSQKDGRYFSRVKSFNCLSPSACSSWHRKAYTRTYRNSVLTFQSAVVCLKTPCMFLERTKLNVRPSASLIRESKSTVYSINSSEDDNIARVSSGIHYPYFIGERCINTSTSPIDWSIRVKRAFLNLLNLLTKNAHLRSMIISSLVSQGEYM